MKYALIPVLKELNVWMKDNALDDLNELALLYKLYDDYTLQSEAVNLLHRIYHANNED